jgi:hypothetical protein
MKLTNYLLLLVIALALTMVSCKKDTKSATEILTSKSWKISSQKLNGVAQAVETCQTDDFLTFASGGTYVYNIGTVTCYDGEVTYDGTWILSADGKTITVDGVIASVVITESQIVVTITDGSDTIEQILIPK